MELSPRGTVWTWTSQEFRPKSPPYAGPETAETFTPYLVGFVEVPEGLCVEARLVGFGGRRPSIGEAVTLVVVPFRVDEQGNEVVIAAFAGRFQGNREASMPDVAIIGVGPHPFGRFPGKSAIEMGADAVRLALKDAGIEWTDVQFAFGGSYEADNPDAVVNQLGLTGIPFTDVYNGCATAASALEHGRPDHRGRGSTRSASPSAWTSTSPARSPPIPSTTACPAGTARPDFS